MSMLYNLLITSSPKTEPVVGNSSVTSCFTNRALASCNKSSTVAKADLVIVSTRPKARGELCFASCVCLVPTRQTK